MRQNRRLGLIAVPVGAMLVTLGASACGELTAVNPGELRVGTVSTRPHLISGGDALVRIEPIFGGLLPDVSVSVNGVDMTQRFRPAPADWLGRQSDALLGLVDRLVVGENTVVVEHGGTPLSSMTVTNYSATGPIFSGEHLEPYLCLEDLGLDREGQPRRFAIGNGDFLVGSALDDDCSLPTRVDFLYRTTDEEGEVVFKGLVDLAQAAGGRDTDDHDKRRHGSLRCASRDRHDQSRHLSDGDPDRPRPTGPHALEPSSRVERSTYLHLRRWL